MNHRFPATQLSPWALLYVVGKPVLPVVFRSLRAAFSRAQIYLTIYVMVLRRATFRRLVVVATVLLLLLLCYLLLTQLRPSSPLGSHIPSYFQEKTQPSINKPPKDLPPLKPAEQPAARLVFPTTPISVHQEAAFADMKQLHEYSLAYDTSNVGSIYVGHSAVDHTFESAGRENATFFSLVRNSDKLGILSAIQSVEDRFNWRYKYDWVFANDEPFDVELTASIEAMVSGKAHFTVIPREFWSYPEWIDEQKAAEVMETMAEKKIKYGGSELYRHMCRFNSGLFFHLEPMQHYRYYWRVEPEIEFRCDLDERDWFKYMREQGKKYAFTLAPLELHTTVENLWETVQKFAQENEDVVAADNNMAFLTEDGGSTYNMCHFWSNFEIGDMDFFRLEPYQRFFNRIDHTGGFYYSRWGDAPVHTMAVSLLLLYRELFFFDNSGYFHHPNGDCPHDPAIRARRRCTCSNARKEFTWARASCIPKWFEVHGLEKPAFVPKYQFENQHKPEEEDEAPEEEE